MSRKPQRMDNIFWSGGKMIAGMCIHVLHECMYTSLVRQPLLRKERERVWWKESHYCVPTLKIVHGQSDCSSVVTWLLECIYLLHTCAWPIAMRAWYGLFLFNTQQNANYCIPGGHSSATLSLSLHRKGWHARLCMYVHQYTWNILTDNNQC